MNALDQLNVIEQELDIAPAATDAIGPFAGYDLDLPTLAERILATEDKFHVRVLDEAARSVTALREVAQLVDGLTAGNKG